MMALRHCTYLRICLFSIFLTSLQGSVFCQTEFDSLKRNSNLDSSYQPSQKATFVTEFAELKISGFIQPALYFDYNNFTDNDLFVTSAIPTQKISDVKFNRFHFSANQSRLGFSFKFPKAGKNTTALLEGDFFSSATGTNTFFRLRHAYLTYGEFLVGQTWTNFGDVAASPNTLDLEGPNSNPSSRVAQVRWRREISKKWSILFALEEPKNDYTPLDSAKAIKPGLPEFVFKPKMKYKHGTWTNSFIYKPIVYTDKDYSFKKHIPAWGFTSSLTYKIGDKSFHPLGLKKRTISVFGIIGDGTQGSVNDFGGLGYEAFPKELNTLESLLYYGGYVSYSFVFKKRWSSTYVYSYLHQERPLSTNQIFKNSNYVAANAVLAVNKYFTIGLELLYGHKVNHDNTSGSAFRVLGIMRLLF